MQYYYVYIIKSKNDGRWYTGSTKDLRKRFDEHNSGRVFSTKSRGPFELIYYEACLNEYDARDRERYLKSGMGKRYLKNRLKRFLSVTGFTLIEMLIAVSIFSIVALSVYSAFRTGTLSYQKIDSAFNIEQSARLAFNRIETDLSNLFLNSDDDSGFKGGSQNLEFFSVTDSFEDGQLSPNISYVKYNFNNNELRRVIYRGIDAFKQDPGMQDEDSYSGIKEVSFKYAYPTPNADKPYDWQDSWPRADDESQKTSLPLAVKIELSAGDTAFTKVVPLPLSQNE